MVPPTPTQAGTVRPASPAAELLTIPQVADVLNVSRAEAYRLVERGELPVFQLGLGRQTRGKLLRVARSDLVHFLAQRRRSS